MRGVLRILGGSQASHADPIDPDRVIEPLELGPAAIDE